MTVLFSWLHVSDLHVGHGSTEYGWDQRTVLDAILSDVKKCRASKELDLPTPLAVLGTGDIAFSGDTARRGPLGEGGEYAEAEAWLSELALLLEIDRKNVFLVPGNHDVQQDIDKDKYVRRLVNALRSGEEQLDKSLVDKDDLELLRTRVTNYLAFAKAFGNGAANGGETPLWWNRRIAAPRGASVWLVGLNTVLVGGRKDDRRHLRMGSRQPVEVLKGASDKDIVVVLSHHPPDWLGDADHSFAKLLSRAQIHLFGHIHDAQTESLRRGGGKQLVSVSAGAVHGDETESPTKYGYSYGALLVDQSRRLLLRVWPRAYDPVNNRFQPDSVGCEDNKPYAEHPIMQLSDRPPRLGRQSVEPVAGDSSQSGPRARLGSGDSSPPEFRFRLVRRESMGLPTTVLALAERLLLFIAGDPSYASLPRKIAYCANNQASSREAAEVEDTWLCIAGNLINTQIEPAPAEHVNLIARLLLPLQLHEQKLRGALAGLITRPLPLEGEVPLGGSLRGALDLEREIVREHRKRILGRDSLIERIESYIDDPDVPVVLLMGQEGIGKSAVVAELAGRRADRARRGGIWAQDAVDCCPWLPGSLLHMAKAAGAPKDVVQLLVAQANALLLDPIKLPPMEGDAQELIGAHPSWNADLSPQHMAWRPAALPHGSDRRCSQRLSGLLSVFERMLCQLVEERGQAVVFIDALDELTGDGSSLAFLPSALPPGATLVLSTRLEGAVEGHVARLSPCRVGMAQLSCETVQKISGLDARKSKELHEKTSGNPYLVNCVVRELENSPSSDFVNAVRDIFASQVRVWYTLDHSEHDEPRFQALQLLSLMEPVGPVSFEDLQGFLGSLGNQMTRVGVRELLRPVASQLTGFEAGSFKLGVRGFAEFVRRETLGTRDFLQLIHKVTEWLATDDEVDTALSAGFLRVWSDAELANERIRTVTIQLVQRLEGNNASRRLFSIYTHGSGDPARSDLLLPDWAARCLRSASELGDLKAMRILGWRLLEGHGVAANPGEGELWLRKAAEGEETVAQWALGIRLLCGRGLKTNTEEAQSWLRKAAQAAHAPAQFELGIFLLDGPLDSMSRSEGEMWLRKAAEQNYASAQIGLGIRLLDGRGSVASFEEGEHWLRRAAEANNAVAQLYLGTRILDGRGLVANFEEGERWLRKAAESDYGPAQHELASRLLDGNGTAKDVVEGEAWLRKVAAAGFPPAQRELGSRLLDGRELAENMVEGESWLRKAADANDAPAQRELGSRLLDGNSLNASVDEGEQWLKRAIGHGNTAAAIELGCHLYRSIRTGRSDHSRLAEVADLFLKAWPESYLTGINLAYLRRRGEAPLLDIPATELLRGGLEQNDAFALVNDALCSAAGFERPKDWDEADHRFSALRRVDNVHEIREWWAESEAAGDPEGALVLAWLTRHGLLDAASVQARTWLSIARTADPHVPSWIGEPAVQPSS